MPSETSSKLVVPKTQQESMQARIDEIGFGRFQLMILLCTGGIMMSEGAEVLIMGSVTTLLDQDWGLSDFVRGFMVSVVFIGFAVGNLVSGAIGDRYGRRPTILLAYVIIGLMGFLTSLTQNAWSMTILRCCVGIGCGIGFPSIYALIPETCPSAVRGTVFAYTISFMVAGEIYASIGVLFIDKDLEGLQHNKKFAPLPEDSWRRLCQWSSLPSFVFFTLSCFFLRESPFFLASQGRFAEAEAVMDAMAAWNGRGSQHREPQSRETPSPSAAEDTMPPKEPNKAPPEFSWVAAVSKCFSRAYLTTCAVMLMAHFTKDFSVFGLNFVFPQYFQETATLATGWEMLIISFVALPGVFLASAVSQSELIGSINAISLLAFLCGLAAFGLLDFGPELLNSICAYVVKFMALSYFIVVVVYTAEVFPTSIRTTAVGLCTACGRLGSISAPLVFELSSGFDFFWTLIIICMWSVAIVSRWFLTMETKGRALTDSSLTSAPAEAGDRASGYGTVLPHKEMP